MDLLIVGSGLTGSTIARLAKDAGYSPLVVERRAVIGGNIRDEIHPEIGLRYNLYGPHYFRTNSEKIWQFVNRFGAWRPWSAEVMTLVDGKLEHWPPNREYIERVAPGWKEAPSFRMNFLDVCLSKLPWQVYGSMVKPYTEKQWGIDCDELDASLASRFSIREDSTDHRLTTHKYQALPVEGYSKFVERMLEGIDVQFLNIPFNSITYWGQPSIFTGPIDELFGLRFGRLPYRSQRREHQVVTFYPPCIQINYPSVDKPFIRQIFWDQMTQGDSKFPSLETTETPYTPTEFDQCEYPVPTKAAQALYHSYYQHAKQFPNLILAGRLAEYRYLDMDAAIARAMKTWETKVLPRLKEK